MASRTGSSEVSGFMGYDRELLHCLRQAMERSVVELDGIRSNDPEAAEAMRSIASTRSLLRDTWLPFVDSLLGCRAMEDYRRVDLDAAMSDPWVGMVSAMNGWSVTTD